MQSFNVITDLEKYQRKSARFENFLPKSGDNPATQCHGKLYVLNFYPARRIIDGNLRSTRHYIVSSNAPYRLVYHPMITLLGRNYALSSPARETLDNRQRCRQATRPFWDELLVKHTLTDKSDPHDLVRMPGVMFQ